MMKYLTQSTCYKPGESNINNYEARLRRETGFISLALTIALALFLQSFQAPLIAYIFVAVPAWFSVLGFLQAHYGFCARYGLQGIQNAESELAEPVTIASERARNKDKNRAHWLMIISIIIGLLVAVLSGVLFS